MLVKRDAGNGCSLDRAPLLYLDYGHLLGPLAGRVSLANMDRDQ
jgi:hypothetical protein